MRHIHAALRERPRCLRAAATAGQELARAERAVTQARTRRDVAIHAAYQAGMGAAALAAALGLSEAAVRKIIS